MSPDESPSTTVVSVTFSAPSAVDDEELQLEIQKIPTVSEVNTALRLLTLGTVTDLDLVTCEVEFVITRQ
jgi:hypothetical protein